MRPLLIASLLLIARASFAAVPLPGANARWYAVDAGDFHVYGNTAPRQTRQVAMNLLRLQQAVALVTRLKVHSELPVYVHLFRDDRSFAPYRDAVFGKKTQFTGAFNSGRDGNFVLMRIDADDRATRIIFHELTHFFVRNTVHDPPPWFNEGLAEYYSTFTSSDDTVEIGRAIPDHIRLLRAQPLIPLRDFSRWTTGPTRSRIASPSTTPKPGPSFTTSCRSPIARRSRSFSRSCRRGSRPKLRSTRRSR